MRTVMTLDAAEFGRRVRLHRKRSRLSQVELGGERYSGSYISHLESGRREATAELALFLAERLGVSPEEFGVASLMPERAPSGMSSGDLAISRAMLAAERASIEGAWLVAAREASRAAGLAATNERPDRWWEASRLEAKALFAQGEYARCADLAGQLAVHEAAERSPALLVEALVLASRSHRASGQLLAARSWSRRAMEAAQDEDPDVRMDACIAHVSALAEMGDLAEAADAADELAGLRSHISSEHGQGVIAWTLGNLAMLGGDVDAALVEYDLALRHIRPEVDLRRWARLHKAVATTLLGVDRVDGVGEHLDVALSALRVVGNPSDLTELRTQQAMLELAQGRPEQAEALLRHCLDDVAMDESPRLAADALRALHRVLLALGRDDEARITLRHAAERYEAAGALTLALQTWRSLATAD